MLSSWGCSSNDKMLAQHAQGPEFNLQYHKQTKKPYASQKKKDKSKNCSMSSKLALKIWFTAHILRG